MSIEAAIRTRLLATSGVTDLASTRVWQLKLPQDGQLPAVRVQLIAEPLSYHLRGADGAVRSLVQVDAVARESYDDASELADAIDAALSGTTFTVDDIRVTGCLRDGRRSFYNPQELRQVLIVQDYIVWHKAA